MGGPQGRREGHLQPSARPQRPVASPVLWVFAHTGGNSREGLRLLPNQELISGHFGEDSTSYEAEIGELEDLRQVGGHPFRLPAPAAQSGAERQSSAEMFPPQGGVGQAQRGAPVQTHPGCADVSGLQGHGWPFGNGCSMAVLSPHPSPCHPRYSLSLFPSTLSWGCMCGHNSPREGRCAPL